MSIQTSNIGYIQVPGYSAIPVSNVKIDMKPTADPEAIGQQRKAWKEACDLLKKVWKAVLTIIHEQQRSLQVKQFFATIRRIAYHLQQKGIIKRPVRRRKISSRRAAVIDRKYALARSKQ